jgi:xanthine dehydrogenase YagT iron-sulfur-binding subunit
LAKRKKSADLKNTKGTEPENIFASKMSRRSFVKATVAGAAVVGFGGVALTKANSQLQTSVSQAQSSAAIQPDLWQDINFMLNGTATTMRVQANWSLSRVLRENLGLTGTKIGCNNSTCGACTVFMDGKTIYSCHRLAAEVNGHEITTIEGIGSASSLHPVQQAFMDYGGGQCGYCTPGQIMSAVALLKSNANPTEADVRLGLSGNICRCGSYVHIIQAVMAAASS